MEWLERDLIFTGHTRGIVKIWSKVIQDGKFCLSMVKRLDCGTSTSQSQGKGSVGPGSITSIFPTHKSVYTGDEDGKVVSFLFFFLFIAQDSRLQVPFY